MKVKRPQKLTAEYDSNIPAYVIITKDTIMLFKFRCVFARIKTINVVKRRKPFPYRFGRLGNGFQQINTGRTMSSFMLVYAVMLQL